MADRSNPSSSAYAALRIVSGVMFTFHGAQKILGFLTPADKMPAAWSQLWFGGLIELIGGILIAIGLFTRPVALLCSGTMAVAYFQFHWKFAMENYAFLPIVNRGEPAVLYCFVFLLFAVGGAGAMSIDRQRGRG
jgi:putative oxidoreductase